MQTTHIRHLLWTQVSWTKHPAKIQNLQTLSYQCPRITWPYCTGVPQSRHPLPFNKRLEHAHRHLNWALTGVPYTQGISSYLHNLTAQDIKYDYKKWPTIIPPNIYSRLYKRPTHTLPHIYSDYTRPSRQKFRNVAQMSSPIVTSVPTSPTIYSVQVSHRYLCWWHKRHAHSKISSLIVKAPAMLYKNPTYTRHPAWLDSGRF